MTNPTSRHDNWRIVTDFEPSETVTEQELDLLADYLMEFIDTMLRDG